MPQDISIRITGRDELTPELRKAIETEKEWLGLTSQAAKGAEAFSEDVRAAAAVQTVFASATKGAIAGLRDITVAFFGVRAAARAITAPIASALSVFDEKAVSLARVDAAFARLGPAGRIAARDVAEFAGSVQRSTRFTSGYVRQISALTAQVTGLAGQPLRDLVKVLLDTEAATPRSAESLALMTSLALEGQRAFRGLPVVLDLTKSRSEILAQIQQQLGDAFGGTSEAVGRAGTGVHRYQRAISTLRGAIGELITQKVGLASFFETAARGAERLAGTLKEPETALENFQRVLGKQGIGTRQALAIFRDLLIARERLAHQGELQVPSPIEVEPIPGTPFGRRVTEPTLESLRALDKQIRDLNLSERENAETIRTEFTAAVRDATKALEDGAISALEFDRAILKLAEGGTPGDVRDFILGIAEQRAAAVQAEQLAREVAVVRNEFVGQADAIRPLITLLRDFDRTVSSAADAQEKLSRNQAIGERILLAIDQALGRIAEQGPEVQKAMAPDVERLKQARTFIEGLGTANEDAITKGAEALERFRSQAQALASSFAGTFAGAAGQIVRSGEKTEDVLFDLGQNLRSQFAATITQEFFETLFSPIATAMRAGLNEATGVLEEFTEATIGPFIRQLIGQEVKEQVAEGAAGAAGGAGGEAISGPSPQTVGTIGAQLFLVGGIGTQNVATVGNIGSAVTGLQIIQNVGSIGAVNSIVSILAAAVIPSQQFGQVGSVIFGLTGLIGIQAFSGLVNAMVFGYVGEVGTIAFAGVANAIVINALRIDDINIRRATIIGGGGFGGFIPFQSAREQPVEIRSTTPALLHPGEIVGGREALAERFGRPVTVNVYLSGGSGNLEDPQTVRRLSRALGREVERRIR